MRPRHYVENRLKDEALSGKLEIPKGEYTISFHNDVQKINLAGGGKDYKINAIKRR